MARQLYTSPQPSPLKKGSGGGQATITAVLEWECSACTFKNSIHAGSCGICSTSRSQPRVRQPARQAQAQVQQSWAQSYPLRSGPGPQSEQSEQSEPGRSSPASLAADEIKGPYDDASVIQLLQDIAGPSEDVRSIIEIGLAHSRRERPLYGYPVGVLPFAARLKQLVHRKDASGAQARTAGPAPAADLLVDGRRQRRRWENAKNQAPLAEPDAPLAAVELWALSRDGLFEFWV